MDCLRSVVEEYCYGKRGGAKAQSPETEDIAIQMFDKVMIVYDGGDKQKECYICIGMHCLFFVSREMSTCSFQPLKYLHIDKAALDEKTNRRMLIQLVPDGDSVDSAFGEQLIIRSDFRQQLIDRIGVCWQAEYMYRTFTVKKFIVGKTNKIPLSDQEELHNTDDLKVKPPIGYDSNFSYRGYSFFLREGFKDTTGMKGGNYRHDEGWELAYGYASNKVIIPPECGVTIHVNDPISIMELEKDPEMDDLRTVATNYRLALSEGLGQHYVLVNNAYHKRLNRTNDVASWEGWELLIRSETSDFVCVMLRRMFIPPLCDMSQDVSVLIRCPASKGMNYDTHEVLMDECRFIADSIAPLTDIRRSEQLYTGMIQARLDALQFNEDAYNWMKGYAGLEPVHINVALKFVKSIAQLLVEEAQTYDEDFVNQEEFDGIMVLGDPMALKNDMVSDYQDYLGESGTPESTERRAAWLQRVSRYLAYALDGGILGDRFTLSNVVAAVGKLSAEHDKMLKAIIEYLLHVRVVGAKGGGGGSFPLMQLLQEPDKFASCEFNERVMRCLLMDNYIQTEWRKRSAGPGGSTNVHYEKLLAALLRNTKIGVGLRTLICRQILEQINPKATNAPVEKQIGVIVPALVHVMDATTNVNLASCATAALVNLSFNHMSTKTLLMQEGCMQILMTQLKSKDDDLTLYTLYLLVNMTKTPQHRQAVVSNGGVPLLVDILSSSYQNLRKRTILTELCSVFGQLCNDPETRSLLSDDYPVASCLLWVFDAAEPNSKLKAKLLFVLRQMCGQINRFGGSGGGSLAEAQNKVKIGQHVIYTLMEELGMARRDCEEVAMNSVLLLTVLAQITTNAKEIAASLQKRLKECKIMDNQGVLSNKGRFKQELIDKVESLSKVVTEVAERN